MTRITGTTRPISTLGEAALAFVPYALPPAGPPLRIAGALTQRCTQALAALARLEVAGAMVPSTEWFLYGFVRREAVLTSQIEGTQATLRDVFEFEATAHSRSTADVQEVCNSVAAFTFCRRELARPRGLPVSTRLLCEAHKRLMRGARGSEKNPGAVRKSQNWIGGTRPSNARFIPPPPAEVPVALAALERWIHSDDPLPPLIKAGLAHAQFETIHPFLDGNGRIGRLLISLLLEHWRVLHSPLLCVSLAFKRHQREYYERLSAVRVGGDWEGWTQFYLACVQESAEDGIAVAGRLVALITRDRQDLTGHARATVAAIQLLDMLPMHPVVTVASARKLLEATAPTARKAIDLLTDLGVLQELTGQRRDRVFAYRKYLTILTSEEQ